MIFNDLYWTCAQVVSFDGEGDGLLPDGTDNTLGGGGTGVPGDTGKTFTQEQVNKFLAEERRKQEAAKKALLVQTEQTYKDLLANTQTLTGKERQTLEDALNTVRGEMLTEKQRAELEKKQLEATYTQKLTDTERRLQEVETRYKDETIQRSLYDAAIAGDAFNPNLIVVQLRQMSKLVEVVDDNGKGMGRFTTVIEFPDVDATTGKAIMTSRSPEDAVKRMKELPALYGGLFKSNIVSGIGAGSTAGVSAGKDGRIDVRTLTPEQYQEIRSKQPELLGLSRKRGQR